MFNIAVISDIHGNAESLRLVLNQLQTKRVDLTVCLGDLLTYGTSPVEVIELLLEYSDNHSLIMIKGNHDQFYFDILSGNFKPYAMPDFVLESIYWTAEKISSMRYENLFDWKESFIYENIYFSHANPFKYGDWRYIENHEAIEESFLKLHEKKCFCGVFGHSHRQLIIKQINSSSFDSDESPLASFTEKDSVIINAGSVGQPRGKGYCYSFLTLHDKTITVALNNFQPDVGEIIKKLNETTMSSETKSKLSKYLRS